MVPIWHANQGIDEVAGLSDWHLSASAPFEQVSVGDYVRWWPDWHASESDRYVDGEVIEFRSGRQLRLRIVSLTGPRWSSRNGFVGDERDILNVGRHERVDRPVPPDPLNVEYDGVKLRHLIEVDEAVSQERNASDRWFSVGYTGPLPLPFTPAQRAAVSSHWSAQLRAKVEASRKADREREVSVRYCEEDEW